MKLETIGLIVNHCLFFRTKIMLSKKHENRAQSPLPNKINEHTSTDFFLHTASTLLSHPHSDRCLCFDSAVLEQKKTAHKKQEENSDELLKS